MTNQYVRYPSVTSGSGGVSSLNTLTGDLILAAGTNITLSTTGNTITINSTGGGGGSGTVTSVALADSTGLFTVTGSPVTTSGTLTLSAYASQAQNAFLAGPSSGGAGAAAFRAITAADVPTLNQNTTGTAANITSTSNSTLTTLSALLLPLSQTTGVATIAQGGTDNGSLSVAAGGLLYTDGTKVQNVGAGSSGQVLQSNGTSAPSWFTSASGPNISALVYITSTYSPSAATPIIYDTVVFDTNSGYSTSTGLYTCPVTGKYLVAATASVVSIVAGFYVRVNSTSFGYLGLATTSISSGTSIVSCTSGDTIGVYSDSTTSYDGSGAPYLNSMSISLLK